MEYPSESTKSLKCSTWVQSQKWQNCLGLLPKQTIQHHSNPSQCPNHWCRRSWSRTVLWRPIRPSRNNTKKKDVLFIIGDWNVKVGSQEIPRITGEFGLGYKMKQGKDRVLPTECTGHNKHPLLKTQEMTLHMDITRWSTLNSDWLYSWQPRMEKLYTVSKNKTGSWLWLRSWTPYCQIQT